LSEQPSLRLPAPDLRPITTAFLFDFLSSIPFQGCQRLYHGISCGLVLLYLCLFCATKLPDY
jgi:hypothetical protein